MQDELSAVRDRVVQEIRKGAIVDVAQANEVLSDLYLLASEALCYVARGRKLITSFLDGFGLAVHEFYPTPADIVEVGQGRCSYKWEFLKTVAATVNVQVLRVERTDDRDLAHKREYEVAVRVQGMDCMTRESADRYELDLEDGAARSEVKAGQLKSGRKHITPKAVTGAKARAITDVLGLKRHFDNQQSALLPLFVPAAVYNNATAPPEVRKAVSMVAAMASMGLYGPAPTVPAVDPSTDEPRQLPPPADTGPPPNEEPPFGDREMAPPSGPQPGAPPAEPEDRQITRDEYEELKASPAYDSNLLKDCGWSGDPKDWPIKLSVFRKAMERAGGAS